jgi:hypothetical protein
MFQGLSVVLPPPFEPDVFAQVPSADRAHRIDRKFFIRRVQTSEIDPISGRRTFHPLKGSLTFNEKSAPLDDPLERRIVEPGGLLVHVLGAYHKIGKRPFGQAAGYPQDSDRPVETLFQPSRKNCSSR